MGLELYIVRGLGFIRDLDDIRNMAVDTRNGTPIRIRDLGTVQIGEQLRLGRVGKTAAGRQGRRGRGRRHRHSPAR